MHNRLSSVWLAIRSFGQQLLLWIDQGGNVILCGVSAVLVALLTGERQAVGMCDETLSAHAWRAYESGTRWGRIWKPVIDFLWSWQEQDEEVNRAAGMPITGHCLRAFWKERLRRGLPPEYRDDTTKPVH